MVGRFACGDGTKLAAAILTCFGLVILFIVRPDYFLLATMFQICESRCFVIDRLLIYQLIQRQTANRNSECLAVDVGPTAQSTRSYVCLYLDSKACD